MTARLVVLLFVCASVAGAPLTPAEKRGRHIYRNGTSVSGRPIAALASGTEMDASIFPCGSCHGPEGRGVPEGNVEPSDIRWRTLQKILLPRNEIGRRRPKYDDAALARTLKDGVDSAGNALSPVMPKFRMADEDLSDLVAYLKRLGDEPQPGLAEDRITVSTTAPGARRVIEAFFADVNAGGGVHGRTLHLGEDGFAYVGAVEGTEASFGEERVPL
ncbi:MAG TPA: c-type cytochrome, partial [Thermoanaerobaculia bacterium]|nr:c-type cytochrome [Thermoanaerobaculia bacterium]